MIGMALKISNLQFITLIKKKIKTDFMDGILMAEVVIFRLTKDIYQV